PDVNTIQHVIEGSLPQQDPPNSIAEAERKNWAIFPNPATDYLFIKQPAGSTILSASLFSIDGKRLLHKEQVKQGIDLRYLLPGTYLLQLQTPQNQPLQFKFTKK